MTGETETYILGISNEEETTSTLSETLTPEFYGVSPKMKPLEAAERIAQVIFIRSVSTDIPILLENLDETTRNVLMEISTVTDKPVSLNDVGEKLEIKNKGSVKRTLMDGVAKVWEAAPEETKQRFPWDSLSHRPIEEAKKKVRESSGRNYVIDEVDLELWEVSQEEDLLAKIEARGYMSPSEIKRIKDYFEGRRKGGKDIESLLNKFSQKLALVA